MIDTYQTVSPETAQVQQHLAAVFSQHEDDQRRLAEKQDIIDKQNEEIARLRDEVVRMRQKLRNVARMLEDGQTGAVPAVRHEDIAAAIRNSHLLETAPLNGNGRQEKNLLADSFVL